MFQKNFSRLFAIKFLGLFSANAITQEKYGCEESKQISEGFVDRHKDAKIRSSRHIAELMMVKGIPGLTVSVSKKGQTVWNAAFGICDVENQLQCIPEARMRIASISKPIFAATVIGPMIEENKLDIKTSVHKYLTPDEFPKQKYKGKEYDITIEQLLSHTSGIRFYGDTKPKDKSWRPIGSAQSQKIYQGDEQFYRKDFYQRDTFRNALDALKLFKSDPLEKEPGEYLYTTYGYTLLSAVAEKAHQQKESSKKEQIEDYWSKVLHREWKMTETSLDQDEPVLSNRARYYMRSAMNGALINAPYVDNSYKWAGGGLVSSVKDLVKFGVALVDSYKRREGSKLKRETLDLLWTERKESYCLGFHAMSLDRKESSGEKRAIYHTGGAVGASSVLIIYPDSEIVVAILTNLENIGLRDVGLVIANAFNQKDEDQQGNSNK